MGNSNRLTKILRKLLCLFSGQMEKNRERVCAILGNTTPPGYYFFLSHLKREREEKKKIVEEICVDDTIIHPPTGDEIIFLQLNMGLVF